MIVSYNEEIPKKDEIITIEQFRFTILEASNTKIDLVDLKITEED
jgi:putative hemolysin